MDARLVSDGLFSKIYGEKTTEALFNCVFLLPISKPLGHTHRDLMTTASLRERVLLLPWQ